MSATTKKKSWSTVKEILFTYLAINKIMYWYNTIMEMNQSDLENVGSAVLMRLLNQDLQLIIAVVAFTLLSQHLIKSKNFKYNTFAENLIYYGIGYFVIMGIAFIYWPVLNFIFSAQAFGFGEFVRMYISAVPTISIGYLVVVAVLEIKLFFKKKGKETENDIFEE